MLPVDVQQLAVDVQQLGVRDHLLLQGGTFQQQYFGLQVLAGTGRADACGGDRAAGIGQLLDLQRSIGDGNQQRHGDYRDAQKHQTAQGLGPEKAHVTHSTPRAKPPVVTLFALVSPPYQGSRSILASQSSDVRTMVSRSSSFGVHPSTARICSALATDTAGSP